MIAYINYFEAIE